MSADATIVRVLGSVYVDRVWQLAESAKTRVALVLALMRSPWTVDELRRNHAADWAFTVQDAAEMHRRRGW